MKDLNLGYLDCSGTEFTVASRQDLGWGGSSLNGRHLQVLESDIGLTPEIAFSLNIKTEVGQLLDREGSVILHKATH